MFNNALQETDPKRRLELVQQFMAEYPDSIHANSAGYLRLWHCVIWATTIRPWPPRRRF